MITIENLHNTKKNTASVSQNKHAVKKNIQKQTSPYAMNEEMKSRNTN